MRSMLIFVRFFASKNVSNSPRKTYKVLHSTEVHKSQGAQMTGELFLVVKFKFKTHQIIQNIHLKLTSHPGFIHAQRENRKFSQQKVVP